VVSDVTTRTSVEARVWEALGAVPDPEIPPCSITDLGIVERIAVADDRIDVDLLPTFVGCPALDVIARDAEVAIRAVAGDRAVRVRFVHAPPWTSDRITAGGREALRAHGLTPPGEVGGRVVIALGALASRGGVPCPFCGSVDTVQESAFGPTLCRSTHFCTACRNPFEAFKPKTSS
jgi:ring-1,2-phenylacetyl-CoA epoxidase subunit PaaD